MGAETFFSVLIKKLNHIAAIWQNWEFSRRPPEPLCYTTSTTPAQPPGRKIKLQQIRHARAADGNPCLERGLQDSSSLVLMLFPSEVLESN